MALFLESVESTVSAKYNGKDLTEMLCEGIAIGDEMLALNEAIYKADFIIHQRSQNLSESAQLLQEAGFLGTVWEKVKNMVKKVWEWIKATWSKFTAKLSEWANRVMDRLSGDTKEIRKSAIKRADLLESVMSNIIDKIVGTVDKISGSRDNTAIKDTEESILELKTNYDEAVKEADKLEGRTTVSKTFAKKVADVAKRIEKSVRAAITKLEKLQSAIDKDVAAMKNDDGTAANTKATADDGATKTGQYTTASEDKGDKREVGTANAKIGFIQKATAILRSGTDSAIGTSSQIMTAMGTTDTKLSTASKGVDAYNDE